LSACPVLWLCHENLFESSVIDSRKLPGVLLAVFLSGKAPAGWNTLFSTFVMISPVNTATNAWTRWRGYENRRQQPAEEIAGAALAGR
jgi:hypothetical protein